MVRKQLSIQRGNAVVPADQGAMALETDTRGSVSPQRLGPSSRIWLAILTFCLATGAKGQPGA